jgi:hypothetical protein
MAEIFSVPTKPHVRLKFFFCFTFECLPDNTVANYLLKALQGFKNKGITAYAISIQNEPENSNPTYPTCTIPAAQEARIGGTLRTLMNNNGFSSTKIIGLVGYLSLSAFR